MEKKDYKDTLNLPDTAFPMKANLPNREPQMLEFWRAEGIFKAIEERNKGRQAYVLHDGPPYANGHIHIGHALNKTLKDIIVKYKSMKGFYSPYVPGWDCHGLPIELEVDKKLGKEKAEISIGDKRLKCREYAGQFIDIQREEFKRLGVFGRWEEPYLTMTFDYEADILAEFYTMFERGYAYKGKKPVHWCPSCVTALAEAEVEYADKTSPSVFVKFRINNPDALGVNLGGRELYIVIWTTTPWTLPANKGLAVGEGIDYAIVTHDGLALIVAEALVDSMKAKGALAAGDEIIGRTKGASLKALRAQHPFVNTDKDDGVRPIFDAHFVSIEDGAGVVHIAPGHGQDDYEAGLANGLEIYAPVDDNGKFAGSGVDSIEGQFVFKANELIIEILKEKNALLGQGDLQHSYPHCWRCKKPVIFRATEQWFISMSHMGLRDKCLEEVNRVQWVPHWGRERIHGMIKGRPDWCISRQRAWGVPIAVFRCKSCSHLVKDQSVLDGVVEAFRQGGADVWFTRSTQELLPKAGYKCPDCGSAEFEREMDILDVWFDSGVSHAATLKAERGLSWPADMYLEGSDQHRGWFQSSLLASVGTRGQAPYRTVLTHGFTVDGRGRKMSKSQGNVVAPQDIIKKTGAEILRLWVSAEDYTGDIRISNEIIDRLTEAYRKIRNTSKYLLGNLKGFDGGDYSADMLEIDRWAMSRLSGLIKRVDESYENYHFHEVYHKLYNFCIVDMSSFYLDILKDRLYTFGADSRERKAAQWVLSNILSAMTRLMAPVLSFTAEEIWQHMEGERPKSVFLADFPVADESMIDLELEKRWQRLIEVRTVVLKALEVKRAEKFIGNALEARVILHVEDKDNLEFLKGYEGFMPSLFIVSESSVTSEGQGFHRDTELGWMSVSVEQASGEKCQRCWNRSLSVGTFSDAPDLCGRCHSVVS